MRLRRGSGGARPWFSGGAPRRAHPDVRQGRVRADVHLAGKRLQHSYLGLHEKAARSGAEPGRNILLHGVESDDGDVRTARRGELRRSIRILKRMTAPALAPAPANEASAPTPSASGELEAIAACESGGDPTAIGGAGMYRGKYQFTYETWQSLGGTGDPAAAPEAEQDHRAAMLLAQGGAGQWPACDG